VGAEHAPLAGAGGCATALIRRIRRPPSRQRANSTKHGQRSCRHAEQSLEQHSESVNGLLTLGADPAGLIAGTNSGSRGEHGTGCVFASRHRRLRQSPRTPTIRGGLSASAAATDATLAAYIAAESVDPSSAIGLAVNIVTAAVQYGLVTQLQAF